MMGVKGLTMALLCLLLVWQMLPAHGQSHSFSQPQSWEMAQHGYQTPSAYSAPALPQAPVFPSYKKTDALPEPACYPDFSCILEMECGEKQHPTKYGMNYGVTRSPPVIDEECAAEVTARELQTAILCGDANCVAQIIIQSKSVKGIEEGFRIPSSINFVQSFGSRQKDPDVAAIRGLALGVLQGAQKDKTLVNRLVESIVPTFTPPPGETPPQKDYNRPSGTLAIPTEDYGGHIAGDTGSSSCSSTTTTIKGNGNSKAVKTFRKCKTVFHTPKPEVDAEKFRASLRDRDLLFDVFTTDPNNMQEKKYRSPHGRHLFFSTRRQLKCSSCENGNSYICSFCWEAKFCSQFHWCPKA